MHLSFRINETSSLFPTKRRTPTFKKGDQKEIQFGSPYGPFLKIWIPILSKKGGPKWDLDDIKKEHFWANKSVNNKKLGIPKSLEALLVLIFIFSCLIHVFSPISDSITDHYHTKKDSSRNLIFLFFY